MLNSTSAAHDGVELGDESLASATTPFSVTRLQQGDKTFTLVGVNNFSQTGLQEVEQFVREEDPDSLCVGLCETRYRVLTERQFWEELQIVDAFRQGKGLLLLGSFAAGAYHKRKGKPLPVRLGSEWAELSASFDTANAKLIFAERDLEITLKRCWKSIPPKKRLRMMFRLLKSIFTKEGQGDGKLDSDLEGELAEALVASAPEAEWAMVHECDQYFMASIQHAEGSHVMALAAGSRIERLKEHFESDINRDALETVPARSWLSRWSPYLTLAVVVGALVWSLSTDSKLPVEDLLLAWVLPKCLMTGLFMLPGGPKLPSLLAAMAAAPFSLLTPALRPGLVVGVVEVMLRKPLVSDAENFHRDVRGLKTIYHNPLARIMLLAWLAHFGSVLANYVGFILIIRVLA